MYCAKIIMFRRLEMMGMSKTLVRALPHGTIWVGKPSPFGELSELIVQNRKKCTAFPTFTISSPLTFITVTRMSFSFPCIDLHFNSPRRSTIRSDTSTTHKMVSSARKHFCSQFNFLFIYVQILFTQKVQFSGAVLSGNIYKIKTVITINNLSNSVLISLTHGSHHGFFMIVCKQQIYFHRIRCLFSVPSSALRREKIRN